MIDARVVLRKAAPDDADAIARLHWLGWEQTYRGALPDALLDGTTLDMRRTQWAAWLPDKQAGLTLAEIAGEAVGFVCAIRARDIVAHGAASEIQLLYVLRQAQGAGVGAALLRAGAGRANALWPGPMGLWVVTGNMRARRFYERMGGRAGPERREVLRGAAIDEVAYLWDDAATLAAWARPETEQPG
jgi:GNAT superfamily N-acetyltransferase